MRWASSLPIRANVRIDVRDAATGRLLRRERVKNLVVLVGRNLVRDALYGISITAPNRFALGTGTTAVTAADTELETEVWRDILTTKTVAAGSITFKYFLTSVTANGHTLVEAGLLNEPSAGDLFARVVFTAIEKTSAITVLFAWTFTIGTP
jgi:hypothetical protein